MIWIGNQTSCWAASPLEPFDYALAQRFDAFEWFPDKKPGAGWDESDLDKPTRHRVRELARGEGVRLSVHARWQANLLEPAAASLVWKDVDLAVDLQAVLLNVHLYHERGIPAFVEAILPLIERTAEAGLLLAVENTPHHSPEQFNELFARLSEVAGVSTRHVGMCFDLGHANLCSATLNNYLGFWDRLASHVPIIHLHLHENWGDADTHLPLFTGPAARDQAGIRGLLARLQQRHFAGSLILEQWPRPPELLVQARDRLRTLFPPVNEERPTALPSAPPPREPPPVADKPEADFAAELVASHHRWPSWREKLDWVRGLLTQPGRRVTAEQLIDLAIYLRFLTTGEVSCAEDGRHFRPAHHARLAAEIRERLARLTTTDNADVIRRIYPCLPSSAPAFQRPEPLTRIRDIAHRNDIDAALKREIKTRLQNKLHRCAGPEDLATSAAILQRISAPGAGYAPAFVEQFRIFHEELKEFFNAQSLEDRLRALVPSLAASEAELVRAFLKQKAGAGLTEVRGALRTLTDLRQALARAWERGGAVDPSEILLADIGLEAHAFVLLSELINSCERLPSSEGDSRWEWAVDALIQALHNLRLSGIEPFEAGAGEAELRAWGRVGSSPERDDLLRAKATLLRVRRLSEDFGARLVRIYSARAEKLGRALGVADHAIRVFAESEIRSHLVFQVSKLATSLLHRAQEELREGKWEVLSGGCAVGRVQFIPSLGEWKGASAEPILALVKAAAGDEEIPERIAGLAVGHSLPHLSHLGVRARQAGAVLVACEDEAEFDRVWQLEGAMMSLQALPDRVEWRPSADPISSTVATPRPQAWTGMARALPASSWIPLERAGAETSGGKAASLGRLAELAREAGSGFLVPEALVVPLGVMERQLHAQGRLAQDYHRRVAGLARTPASELPAATHPIRELVHQLIVPEEIGAEVVRRFGPERRVMVRSSANCEDLAGQAGAGLYDSVANVPVAEVASAIRTVWSSLWTDRAVASRQQAGLPHSEAHMAVLIQAMVAPELAFVLHTVNPISRREDEIYAELVVGLGETLVSAASRGNPYRLLCAKPSGMVTTLAFANYSQAIRLDSKGGLKREWIDYSSVPLSRDRQVRVELGARLAAVARSLERALGGPQDIEGAVAGGRIYLVQARPQVGLREREEQW